MKKLLSFSFLFFSTLLSSNADALTHDFEINEVPRIEAILKHSENFYAKLKKNSFNYEKTLNEDPLNSLLKNDYNFLKKRLLRSGLAPFKVDGTRIFIQSKDFNKLDTEITVDFKNYYQSTLIVQGIPYPFDPTLDLESLHNKYFKDLWKKYSEENKKTSYFPSEIFSAVLALQGCTPADKEKSANTTSLVLAYARLCADCVGIATAPYGLAINAGMSLADYAMKSGKSSGTCRSKICSSLPVVGPLNDIVRLHEERKALNHRSDSSK